MQLSELQKTIWQTLGQESAATETIRNSALQYYISYRQHLKAAHSFLQNQSKIQTLLLISYFISEKSQIIYDLKGNKITNIAFSINQLAKKHNDYKEFFYHLKEIMRVVSLPPQAKQSEEEINSFMKYFSFLMTFYNKYLSTFDKITICHNINSKDLESIGGQKQYKDKIKYFLWVVFITFRKVVFKNSMDTIGNTCLLACLFGYFIREIYKQQKITSIYAPDIAVEYGTFSNQFAEIEETWMGFFCLKDVKTFVEIRNIFLQFIQNLTSKIPQIRQPFGPKVIFMNIKKLQEFYHKNIDIHQMDETLFLANLMSNQENIRFTAFGAKRKVAKQNSNNLIQCRRALNYETEIKNSQLSQIGKKQACQNGSNNYLDVIKNIKASQTPVMLIQATPINQFATAYNWLYTKSISISQNQPLMDLQKLLQIGARNDSFQLSNNYIIQKRKLVEGLFKELLQQLKEETQQNFNVASILALEVFYYVMNITNREITEIVEALNVSWFDVWKGVDALLNYDKNMPNNVKTHLLLLETSIVSTLIWKDYDFIQTLSQTDFSESYKDFFYRVLHHIAYQINFIGKSINLPENLMDQAFLVCQYYLKQWAFMMPNINLDVIIMCSLYGVCRAKSIDIKFKTIILSYKEVNNVDQKAFEELDCFQNEQGETYNIILYYNKVFVKNCKSFLLKIKEEKLHRYMFSYNSDDTLLKTKYVLSPVKEILPKGLQVRGNTQGTPTYSQMLFAYNQSPLLKNNKKLTMTNSTKQNLDYTISKPKKISIEPQTLRQRSTNISEMIQMKCKYFLSIVGNGKTPSLIPKGYHLRQV